MQPSIETWLEKFTHHWKLHEVDEVLRLFTSDVEYWESPFKHFSTRSELETEWQSVTEQLDIDLKTDVFSSVNNHHTITWQLRYLLKGSRRECAGTYLIRLNDGGLCDYFMQTCEAAS